MRILVVEPPKRMSKETPLLVNFQIKALSCTFLTTEESLIYFKGVSAILISCLQFAFTVQCLFECFWSVLVVEGPFEGVAEDLIGFCECIELMGCECW